jgi:hypothetical protein
MLSSQFYALKFQENKTENQNSGLEFQQSSYMCYSEIKK